MKRNRVITGSLSVLIALTLAVSPAFAAEDQLVAVGEIAPNDKIDIFGAGQLSASQTLETLEAEPEAETEAEAEAELGFQISNHSLDMCLKETGQTWKEWYAASQKRRQEGSKAPVSLQDILTADPKAAVYSGEEGTYMITGENLPLTAADMEEAFYTAYQLLSLLGRDEDTDLTLRSVISEGNELPNSQEFIYVFQEINEGEAVRGSTLRLVSDEQGQVKAVFSSLYAGEPSYQETLFGDETIEDAVFEDEAFEDALSAGTLSEDTLSEDTIFGEMSFWDALTEDTLPEDILSTEIVSKDTDPSARELVDAETAEMVVQQYLEDRGIVSTLLPDFTSQIFVMPAVTEDGESVMVADADLPEELCWVVYSESDDGSYLAHYLTADGTYLYHQTVKEPGDEAGQSGSDTTYLFDGLEAGEYTGDVTYLNGETSSLTVPVMKDPETGIYYLGDVQRRIVFADFYDYIYGDMTLTLLSSEDNTGWSDDDLITYDTFLKAWDFYASMGWIGGNGLGTPILMLKEMQFENGLPMDNAAYGTILDGWATFAYDNSGLNYQEALDVWAHEFTHAVTTAMQGYNLYQNDQGAINESMSDIMGNLCEMLIDDENDRFWQIGEDTMESIRAMTDPHVYGQPEYVWDLYYGTSTSKPNEMNDRGGVHSNSSILNLLAARLCGEYGMPWMIARDFWLRLASMLTPMTDLPQIADVLEWVVRGKETEQWSGAMHQLIEAGQFRRVDAPLVLEDGRKMVMLELPDTPAMTDENWILIALQLGDLSDILDSLIGELFSEDSSDDQAQTETEETLMAGLVNQYTSWTNGKDQTIYMQIEDRPALYMMLNMDIDTMSPLGAAFYLNGKWHDIAEALTEMQLLETADHIQFSGEEAVEAVLNSIMTLVGEFLPMILETEDAGEVINEGTTVILPSNGLEQIQLLEPDQSIPLGF